MLNKHSYNLGGNPYKVSAFHGPHKGNLGMLAAVLGISLYLPSVLLIMAALPLSLLFSVCIDDLPHSNVYDQTVIAETQGSSFCIL